LNVVVDDDDGGEYGAPGGIRIGRGNSSTREGENLTQRHFSTTYPT
jgi:hypothetical protein